MNVGIMQPNYLPWLGYFDMMACSDVFVVYDTVQYDRRSWRNRNRLLARPTPLWVTAPTLNKGHYTSPIRDIRLADTNWQSKHLKTIRQIYSRAPHFDWLYPALESYLSRKQYSFLLDLCIEGHQTFNALMRIEATVRLASELDLDLDPELVIPDVRRTERLIAICRKVGATRYISASASRAYMVEELWTRVGIELRYQDYVHPTYSQFGDEFISHLSAIDALMFVGPEAKRFIGISVPRD